MKSLKAFLRQLETLVWSPAGYIDPRLPNLLQLVGQRPEIIHDAVAAWKERDLEKRGLRCHETATHYKWFIHYNERLHYRVWLHQYKTQEERLLGHAEVPHNHRYSLGSLIVNGGFDHHIYERSDNGLVELTDRRRLLLPGNAYTVEWLQVHKLSALREHTLTLVVETPVVRHFSEAFYDEECQPSIFYDFVELYGRLFDATSMTSIGSNQL